VSALRDVLSTKKFTSKKLKAKVGVENEVIHKGMLHIYAGSYLKVEEEF
jgi:hypothetical protein